MSDKQRELFQQILNLTGYTSRGATYAISRLAAQGLEASQPPAVKGAVWVKASDRLPSEKIEKLHAKYQGRPYIASFKYGNYFTFPFGAVGTDDDDNPAPHELEDVLWLDESQSPTAAGDGEPRETIENILYATGKFFEEQCTELAEVILKEIKGAGDGKEAIEFAEWAMNNFGIARNSSWKKIWAGPGPKQFATAQLYDIFKQQNK